ncbi:THUMP domain-containing class I SAM-dependent RNA methyltransferase [Neisseria sp. Ec49-e6-T10]|uniref:THUMP domain-containing class I SAM-dependent RNA methyltransferase n=1 Tax=Neisseria sp. Ec49-e6-T10 TaxID=3140744 RepID=UPI003EBBB9A4
MNALLKCFVPCPRGLEEVLMAEISTFGCSSMTKTDGGVSFSGSLETVYKVNLGSRIASRVLWQVGHGKVQSEQDVYAIAKKVAWPDFFDVHQTFKVKVDGKGAKVRSLDFIGLKVKDALCDVFREVHGERPNVEKFQPDVRIHVFINATEVFLFVDTSGEALFKRGYRVDTGLAPLRENLAAGILTIAGFDGSQSLLDPMCGSGTIAIEAALIARNIAPGIKRRFGFEALKNFNATAWQDIKNKAIKMQKKCAVEICASDIDRRLIQDALTNAQAAGVADDIDLGVCDVTKTRPHTPEGLIVTNPPYGVRLDDEERLAALYPQLGSWLKQYFAGWTACFFSGDMRLPKLMRLSPKRKWPLFNGAIDCRLFVIEMVSGSNRKK